MVYTPTHPDDRSPELHDKINLKNADKITESWCQDLQCGYTLYKLLPSVGTLDPVYGLAKTERWVDDATGDLVERESLIQVGNLDLTTPETSDSVASQIADTLNTTVFNKYSTMNDLTDVFTSQTSVDSNITAVHGNILIAQWEPSPDLIDEIGDFNTLNEILTVLIEADEYPLATTEEDDVYEFQCQFTLTPLWRHEVAGMKQWLDQAIEDYHEGVFANKPSLAVIHAINTYSNDIWQAKIADLLGIDTTTVSRQLSKAETWLTRAEHSTTKYSSHENASTTPP